MHDLLTTAEAATRLGINRATLTRWVAAGKIRPKATTTTGAMFFDPATVDEARCPTCGRVDLDAKAAS